MSKQKYIQEHAIDGSVFIEKRCNVKRVPTLNQVQDFLDLFEYGTRWHAFFNTGFVSGLRPIELCNLSTDNVIVRNGRWVGLCYQVGKAKPPGRPKKGEKPKKAERKWNRIDELNGDIPTGALQSLQTYWRLHHQKVGRLFPKCYSQYGKTFSKARKRMITLGHANWALTDDDYFHRFIDKNGNGKIEHDITPYSMRRFFISCYHWLVSAENRNGVPDLLQTQRRMAHSNFGDTATYVYSWRDLGITADDVGLGWEVLTGMQPQQTRLNEF